jgi:hypothetical protein
MFLLSLCARRLTRASTPSFTQTFVRRVNTMSESATPTPTPSDSGPSRPASTQPQAGKKGNQKAPKPPKKELKVLMLHGT